MSTPRDRDGEFDDRPSDGSGLARARAPRAASEPRPAVTAASPRAGRRWQPAGLGPPAGGTGPGRAAPACRPRSATGGPALRRRAARSRAHGAGVPPTRPTSSARRAGRCSTAGRSPTAAARRTPSSRDLLATAPVRARARRHRAGRRAARPRGHPGAGRLRRRLPAGPVAGAAVRGHRGAPARRRPGASGSPRPGSGGTAPAGWSRWPAGTRRSTRRWLLLAAEDGPQLRRLVAGPRRPGAAARQRRRRRVLVRPPAISRRSGRTATGRS